MVRNLHDLDKAVVVVEPKPREDLLEDLHKLDIPVLQGDGTREAILEAAGIRRARVLILCTQNDNLNLQMAVKARSLNPQIQVVMRIFDDDFARALEKQFGFSALSATGMAAPVFAATAAGMDISHPITVEGQALSLARLNVLARGKLARLTVAEVEAHYRVSVVLLRHANGRDLHPSGDKQLAGNDVLVVLGGPHEINHLAQDNK